MRSARSTQTSHDVLQEVVGLDRSDLEGLSRWQLAALAMEVIDALDERIDGDSRGSHERRAEVLAGLARAALTDLRNHFD